MSTTDDPNSPASAHWAARLGELEELAVAPRRAELRRLGAAARDLVQRIAATEADVDELADLADRMESLADRLGDARIRSFHEGFGEAANSGDPHGFFDHSPLLGVANPLAPPLVIRQVDDRIEGRVNFGPAYEGPPGCVHGGYIAAAFDELLGAAQSMSGDAGMTGRLTVHYRSPTPLLADLDLVGRFERREGRKIFTSGTIHVDGVLCAEAEALFISVDFARLMERRAPGE